MKLNSKMESLGRKSEGYVDYGKKTKKFYAEHADWVSNSNNCINMKLIQTEDQLFDEDGYFHPIYTNQVHLTHSLGLQQQ